MVDETITAAYTGRSRRALQKDRLLGIGFPYYKLGRRVVYDLNEIEQYLATCARGPRTAA
jgi:hypothetical protein